MAQMPLDLSFTSCMSSLFYAPAILLLPVILISGSGITPSLGHVSLLLSSSSSQPCCLNPLASCRCCLLITII